MQVVKPYRHELKYYISSTQAYALSKRLQNCMDRDENVDDYGEYHIRSLYFDDMYNSGYQTKVDGLEDRKKYRIRIYNLSDKVIKLECKEKVQSYIRKSSLTIDKETCEQMVRGNGSKLLQYGSELGNMVYIKMQTQLLRPVVIVDYVREAFCASTEDVRITFDKDLRTAAFATDMFDPHLPTFQVLEEYDMIMEIKFNNYLPLYYRDLINDGGANMRSAASKYCMARRFEF